MVSTLANKEALRIEHPPATLREIALERMREAIITGRFAPGERLVERPLCERLGVSRSVVREVIRNLESEGLVETVRNQGPKVARMDQETAAQIYEIRAQLEATAAAACASVATADTVSLLDSALEALSAAHAAGDPQGALRATTKYYEIMFLTGGKSVAWDVVQRLNGRISQLRAMTLSSEGRHETGMKRLRQIRSAIEQNDCNGAAAACKRHVQEAAAIAQRLLSG